MGAEALETEAALVRGGVRKEDDTKEQGSMEARLPLGRPQHWGVKVGSSRDRVLPTIGVKGQRGMASH